jgi:hypothetical protein
MFDERCGDSGANVGIGGIGGGRDVTIQIVSVVVVSRNGKRRTVFLVLVLVLVIQSILSRSAT